MKKLLINKKLPNQVNFHKKIADIGETKYLPSYSQEWKDTIYSYNQNTMKNIPSHHMNANKIIQSYFDLHFSIKNRNFLYRNKYISIKRRRKLLRKIYISNPDIKFTNDKAIINLFTLNREKNYLLKKYIEMNKNLHDFLIQRHLFLYKENIMNIYNSLHKDMNYYLLRNKSKFIQYKLHSFNQFITIKNLYLEKVWNKIIFQYAKKHLAYLRKYELLYSLNQLKFNKWTLLNKLSTLLNKIFNKKIEYNIINVKSIIFHSDLFVQALALKFKKRKSFHYQRNIKGILNKSKFPFDIDNRPDNITKKASILNNYKDMKIISYNDKNLDQFIESIYSSTNIHKQIFHSIKYKNLHGIKIEAKGRLTRRYRADRSIEYKKWKGGLQKMSLNTTLLRGDWKPNISYSMANNTRRVGSFAIKGWISGK